jgi:hypothetical protein
MVTMTAHTLVKSDVVVKLSPRNPYGGVSGRLDVYINKVSQKEFGDSEERRCKLKSQPVRLLLLFKFIGTVDCGLGFETADSEPVTRDNTVTNPWGSTAA